MTEETIPHDKITRISEFDPQYQTYLQSDEVQRGREITTRIFGAPTIQLIDSLAVTTEIDEETKQKRISESLKQTRDKLGGILSSDPISRAQRAQRIYLQQSILAIAKEQFGDEFQDQDIVDDEKVDEKSLEEILRKYLETVAIKKSALEKNVPTYMEHFKRGLQSLAEIDLAVVDPKIVEERLSRVRFDLEDPLVTMSDASGYHHYDLELITIPLFSPYEEWERSIFHESLHQIAGRTIVSSTFEDIEDQNSVINIRSGLGMTKYRNVGTSYFEWMNEGLTEELTEELLPGSRANYGYQKERQILFLIREIGNIDPKVFFDAYFESDIIEPGSKPQAEKRAAMFRAINNAIGNGTLKIIDTMIRKDPENGLDSAIKMLEDMQNKKQQQSQTEQSSFNNDRLQGPYGGY